MNILIFNWRDIKHPLAGGAEISLFEHAKYWQRKGANIKWFGASYPGSKREETIEGIKILRYGSVYTVHVWAAIKMLQGLAKNADVIIDSFHFIPFFTPLLINRNKILALINEPAKNAWFKNIFFPISFIGYIIEPFFFRLYQNIYFITSATSIVAELKQLGIESKNIVLIPHGVSIKTHQNIPQKKSQIILYLATLTEDKGIKDAIYALFYIKKRERNAKLWVVGKAPNKQYEEDIKKLIKSLQLQNDVILYGFVSETKKEQLLAKSSVLVHPSIREGWGLNIIEANTFGVPAVGYNVTGLRDSIVHNKTGMLTKKNTPEEIASTVLFLFHNSGVYNQFSKNAKKWAGNFEWKKAGEKSWKLIQTVYEKK